MRVSAVGGTPEVLIPLEGTEEVGHGPQVLPGEKAVLFTLGDGRNWDNAQIVVHSLETGERKVLIEGGRDARYVPTGHLVYVLDGTLLAVPFDLDKLEVTGGLIPMAEGVMTAGLRSGAAPAISRSRCRGKKKSRSPRRGGQAASSSDPSRYDRKKSF